MGSPGMGGWEQTTGILRLTSLATKTINAYTIIFNVTNQNIDQQSPPVSVSFMV
jgi:hypothetical protein